MVKDKYILKDPVGFHARPAGLVAKEAGIWASSVILSSGEKKANAKSMISIMAMGIKTGAEFEIILEGPDEEEAYKAIDESLKENGLV